MIKHLLCVFAICALTTGCATKSLKVTAPAVKAPAQTIATVKIDTVNDLRKFVRAPQDPSMPSIEGDTIDDKKITDKAIGRMRHGMFHNALWNYSLKDKDTIYSVCERIASNSLTAAGYRVVDKTSPEYASATPVTVDVLQFWIWMQPKFNIDLNYDGELALASKDKSIVASAKATNLVSTAMATGGVWEKTVDGGIAKLQANLTEELIKNNKNKK
jgi:hypothetical protein